MTRFDAGDVVRVHYPHVESNVRRFRPAMVVSKEPLGPEGLLIWVAMITSAKRKSWPGDVKIEDHQAAGLPIASVVRTVKVATLETVSADKVGQLAESVVEAVQQQMRLHLGLN
jgi:mRNA-degrading endonuclease toxin of MazEF toxin-antitoxin module